MENSSGSEFPVAETEFGANTRHERLPTPPRRISVQEGPLPPAPSSPRLSKEVIDMPPYPTTDEHTAATIPPSTVNNDPTTTTQLQRMPSTASRPSTATTAHTAPFPPATPSTMPFSHNTSILFPTRNTIVEEKGEYEYNDSPRAESTLPPPYTTTTASRTTSDGSANGGGGGGDGVGVVDDIDADIAFPDFSDFPPVDFNIFDPQHHGDKYKEISNLLSETSSSENEQPFLREFTDAVKEEVLLVGSLPVEELQLAESRVREHTVSRIEKEREMLINYKKRLDQVVERARSRLAGMMKSKLAGIRSEASRMRQDEQLQRDRIDKAFRAAETQLIDILEKRKGEVKALYGDLVLANGIYSGTRGRRWRIDWDSTPQPVQIKLHMLRGVRDRLPAGRYAVVVSLQDRLGGRILRWSSLRGQEWAAATLPVNHGGRYSNVDLPIEQSVFTACPSSPQMKPSMVMIFELYLLVGDNSPTDRVLAWGAFPIADTTFNTISGCFKLPLLNGPVDVTLDKFQDIEKRISKNLDNWLCNMYFEVIRLPRYVSGQREYEVSLQFTSGLLSQPSRAVDTIEDEESVLAASYKRPSLASLSLGPDGRPRTAGILGLSTGTLRKRIPTAAVPNRRDSLLSGESLGGGVGSNPNDMSLQPILEHHEVDSQPGVSFNTHVKGAVDQYQDEAYSMIPKSRLGEPRQLTEQEKLDGHTYSVLPPLGSQYVNAQSSAVKLEFVSRQLLSELGLSQIKSGEFWFSILTLLIMFWLRIYAHYFGQWLYLQGLRIPVSDFTFLPVTVELNYQASALLAREEIGVVCFGPIMLILVMLAMTLLSALSQWLLGSFSSLASRFVCAWGLLTIIDPILIAIVDLGYRRWRYQNDQAAVGDAFKLYWYFYNNETSGLPGVFLTIFLYAVLMMTASVLFYIYFLRLHMDGRMMDTYHRLNCSEVDFLIPYDTEVSNKELKHITAKAEQWRGPKGERRKVAVYDYVWKEEDGPQEVTTHVSIHTIHLDGSRDLFRQFLRLPDGAIVEIFGTIAQNIDGRIRINLQRANVDLGRLLSGAATMLNNTLHTTGDLNNGTVSPISTPNEKSSVQYSMRKQSIFRAQHLAPIESRI